VKTKSVDYTYDAFDRLIGKQVDDDGDGTMDRAEYYVYDGQDVVLVYKDADGSGSQPSALRSPLSAPPRSLRRSTAGDRGRQW